MTSKNLSDGSSAPKISTAAATEPAQPSAKPDGEADAVNLSTKRDASWPSVLFYIHLNILGLYGVTVLFTNAYLTTVIFTALLSFIGIIGVTCGAHRLWAHKTYEASTTLRLFLMLCHTMAGQVIYARNIHDRTHAFKRRIELCRCQRSNPLSSAITAALSKSKRSK